MFILALKNPKLNKNILLTDRCHFDKGGTPNEKQITNPHMLYCHFLVSLKLLIVSLP